MTSDSLRLGLFGGTFNPIHLGHLRAAEEVFEAMSLDKILFIPSAEPPHKDLTPVIGFPDRLEMTRLAIAPRPGFEVSDMEGRRPGPSYTIHSLRYLREIQGPDAEFYFIIGHEAFCEISIWREFRALFDLTNFVVISRPVYDPARISSVLSDKIDHNFTWDAESRAFKRPDKPLVFCLNVTSLEISSTEIRARLARASSIRYLVPEPVIEYIKMKGLYQTASSVSGGKQSN